MLKWKRKLRDGVLNMAGNSSEEKRGIVLDEQELLKLWRETPQLVEALKDLRKRVKRLEGWLVGALFLILLNLTTSIVGAVLGYMLKKI